MDIVEHLLGELAGLIAWAVRWGMSAVAVVVLLAAALYAYVIWDARRKASQ